MYGCDVSITSTGSSLIGSSLTGSNAGPVCTHSPVVKSLKPSKLGVSSFLTSGSSICSRTVTVCCFKKPTDSESSFLVTVTGSM
jgi:hypothetical protein